jgi:murein DD-endopeptidase MepM/ murein hydrolase activator NlpD
VVIAAVMASAVGAAPARAAGSAWRWPVLGVLVVVRGFEPPPTPYAAGHRGVDLAAGVGSVVVAAGNGVVAFAGSVGNVGVVTIRHGPLRTTYEPVVSSVRVGQQVDAGEVIGKIGPPTGHCGRQSCLHWGLLRGQDYLDPRLLLAASPVRLLPVWSAGSGVARVPRAPPPPAVHLASPARAGASGRPEAGVGAVAAGLALVWVVRRPR